MIDGLIIDCFAGGGGASTGIEMALGRHIDIAVKVVVRRLIGEKNDENRRN